MTVVSSQPDIGFTGSITSTEIGLVRMPVQGRSMWPTLHPDDVLHIRLNPGQLRRGDIAVFRRDNALFAHRFLAVRWRQGQRYYLAKGDGQWAFDPLWPEQALFGVAEFRERDGERVWLTSVPARRRWLWVGRNLAQGVIHRVRFGLFLVLILLALAPPIAQASVSLVSFEPAFRGNDVLVRWETASEVNSLGFNLYRRLLPAGAETQLNPDIIPAQGEIVGAVYEFVDRNPPPAIGYAYRLEEISADGGVDSFGPVPIYRATATATATPTQAIPTATPTIPATATPTAVRTPPSTATSAPTITPIGFTTNATPTANLSTSTPAAQFPVAASPTLPPPTATAPPLVGDEAPAPPSSPLPDPTTIALSPIADNDPTPTPAAILLAPDAPLTPTAVAAAQSPPTPTPATEVTDSVAAAIPQATPLRFADVVVASPNLIETAQEEERTPARIFALLGFLSLAVAGILAVTLFSLRGRWGR